jgi:hypothetical protein
MSTLHNLRMPPSAVAEPILLPWQQQIRAIFKHGDVLHFKMIHGTREWKTGLPETKEDWMLYDGADEDVLYARLRQYEQDGFNIYICIATFDYEKIRAIINADLAEGEKRPPRRVTENIATVNGEHVIRAVGIECDDDGEASLAKVREAVAAGQVPTPTLVIQSSTPAPDKGGSAKYHFWWAVDGFTLSQQEAMNRTLQQTFGGDAASTDAVRVLRLAGFVNNKPNKYPHKPVVRIVEATEGRYTIDQFNLPIIEEKPQAERPKASSFIIEGVTAQLEENAALAGFDLGKRSAWQGTGFQFEPDECPNADAHSPGESRGGFAVRVMASGARDASCFHGHCKEDNPDEGKTLINWKWFKDYLNDLAGENEELDWSNSWMVATPEKISQPAAPTGAVSATDPREVMKQMENESGCTSYELFQSNRKYAEACSEAGDIEKQARIEKFAELQDKCDESTGVKWAKYPVDAWDGTLYSQFAKTCQAGDGEPNFIPLEYFINVLMTFVGAIAGHRIHPTFNTRLQARFYTTLISTVGGIGKDETLAWTQELLAPANLTQAAAGFPTYQNIGTYSTSFASERGALERFKTHPNVLQIYGEYTTLLEKYRVPGSGDALKDLNLSLADGTEARPSSTKTFKGVLPPKVYNSILGCTTIKRWEHVSALVDLETMTQRSNVILTDEERTVLILQMPDFTGVREMLFPRLAALVTHMLVWNYSPEARAVAEEWYLKHKASKDEDVRESVGRINVYLQRIIGHLAFCLAPLPVDATTDLISLQHGQPALDKEWAVEVSADIVRRAIRIADNQMANRTATMPTQGVTLKAIIENLLRKHIASKQQQRWYDVARSMRKYDRKALLNALENLVAAGVVQVITDPEDERDETLWIIVRKKRVDWLERRGGRGKATTGKLKTEATYEKTVKKATTAAKARGGRKKVSLRRRVYKATAIANPSGKRKPTRRRKTIKATVIC